MQLYNLYKLLKEELKNGSSGYYQEAVKTVVTKRCVLIDEPKGKGWVSTCKLMKEISK